MSGFRRCLRVVVLLTACTCAADRAAAQNTGAPETRDPFSRGAAAYAQGDRDQAAALLADAIRVDPHDPRPYYLRALCLARTGHPVEARADLVVAAALEAREPDRYPVDDSLAGLSAPDRTLLNQFRWRSHSEDYGRAFDEGLIPAGVHPVAEVRSDAAALRQKVSVPLGQLTKTGSLADLANSAVVHRSALAVEKGSDPFSDDPAASAIANAPTAPAEEDPFGASPDETQAAAEALPEPQDPFAGSDADHAAPASKVPPSKLFGIFRRVVSRAAPLPSLDGVREHLPPGLPLPGAASPPPAGNDPFGSAVQPAAFSEEADFGEEPAADQTPDFGADEQPAFEAESAPAAASEADPFG